jgi:serine protease Do
MPNTNTALRSIVPLLAFALAAAASRADDPATRVVLSAHDMAAEDSRSVDRRGGNHPPAVMEMENAAFLGVETAPVSETLTDQLNLPMGIGLVVLHIATDSPAAASLKAHDILLKLDDQQLVDSLQLAVLIRNHKEGDEVTLTYLRGGKEATAKATLVIRQVPKLSMDSAGATGGHHDLAPERVQGMLSMMSPRQAGVVRDDGNGEAEIRIFRVNTGNSHVSLVDHLGALELTVVDGKQTLVAKDANGVQLFSGPVDTPEQRKGLPPGVREHFDQLESQIKLDLSYKLDEDLKRTDSKAEPTPPRSSMMRAPRAVPAPALSLL